ncbi:MAG TPA: hypothetical protein VG318_09530 [Actinomycetota bacterium]|nr:hypothetical protein [Actinomycetota bacterium]
MIRTKLAVVSAAAVALVAVPVAATPAAAQPVAVNLPCEVFADPYDYPCGVAEQTSNFAIQQAWGAVDFVTELRDEAGEVAFRVFCTAFPNHPACL